MGWGQDLTIPRHEAGRHSTVIARSMIALSAALTA